MKKRTIAVLLTMTMAAAMMAGCGSKSDSKTADGERAIQSVFPSSQSTDLRQLP